MTADDVDVVHICSPNATHAPLATLALEAGKHVICEKPLATASAEADALVASAEQSGRVATVPFVYRFHPVVREARARVRGGELGPVRLITGGYLQDWLASAEDDNWRVDASQGGPSRAFADIGSHWCDLVEFISGERISALCAQTATVFGERADARPRPRLRGAEVPRADVTAPAARSRPRTRSPPSSAPQAAPTARSRSPRSRRAARTTSTSRSPAPRPASASSRSAPRRSGSAAAARSEIVTRDPGTLGPDAAPYAVAPAGHPQGYLDCFDLFVADTYAAMRGEGAPEGLPTFADGARSAHLIDAVLASAAAGAWVEVP